MNSLRKNTQTLRYNFKEKKLTRERYKNNLATKKKKKKRERRYVQEFLAFRPSKKTRISPY